VPGAQTRFGLRAGEMPDDGGTNASLKVIGTGSYLPELCSET
jgi:hypothetical protein